MKQLLDINNLSICSKLLRIFKNNKFHIKSKIKFIKDRPGHDQRYALNSNKIKKKLKWSKQTNINDGLNKTVMWYVNNILYFKGLKKKDIIKRFGFK